MVAFHPFDKCCPFNRIVVLYSHYHLQIKLASSISDEIRYAKICVRLKNRRAVSRRGDTALRFLEGG